MTPVIQQAYKIHIRAFARQRRQNQETEKIIHSLQRYSWNMVQAVKIPTKIAVPQTLDWIEDGNLWSDRAMGYYRDPVEEVPEDEEEKIQSLLCIIYEEAQEEHRRGNQDPSR